MLNLKKKNIGSMLDLLLGSIPVFMRILILYQWQTANPTTPAQYSLTFFSTPDPRR